MGGSLKALRKALNTYYPELTNDSAQYRKKWFDAARGTEFWWWGDPKLHMLKDCEAQERAKALDNPFITCCYNHMIGLPKAQDGISENPLFPFQGKILDALKTTKHLAIVKSSGLGITELFIRYLSWLCLRDDTYRNTQMLLLTGPRQELTVGILTRMKNLFSSANIFFDSKSTVLELNGCRIEAVPSRNLNAARGLPALKFAFLDEADHFENYADEARACVERYIGKSDPYIVMVSTPAAVNSLLHRILQEKNSLYTKILLPYTVGLGTIYDTETILQASRTASFQREYNLSFSSFGSKSVFRLEDLNVAKRLGDLVGTAEQAKNNPEVIYRAYKMCGLDVGYTANSKTALVILGMLEYYNEKTNTNSNVIQTLFSKTWSGEPHELLVNEIMGIFHDYHIIDHEPSRVYIDGSNLAMIKSLKYLFQDQENYYVQLEASRKHGWKLERMMRVIPVMFGSSAKQLLANLIYLISNKYIGIHESHAELLGDLGSAIANELALDKTTNSQDLTDAMRLAASGYKVKG